MTEISDDELEHRMRANLFKKERDTTSVKVESRSKFGRQPKIDPSEFVKSDAPSPVQTLKPKRIRETYEFHKYSPEYGPEYWVITKLQYGQKKTHKKCDTEALLHAEIGRLRSAGCSVKEAGA